VDESLEVLVPAGQLVSRNVLVPGVLVEVGGVGLSHHAGQDGGDQAPTVQTLPIKALKGYIFNCELLETTITLC